MNRNIEIGYEPEFPSSAVVTIVDELFKFVSHFGEFLCCFCLLHCMGFLLLGTEEALSAGKAEFCLLVEEGPGY